MLGLSGKKLGYPSSENDESSIIAFMFFALFVTLVLSYFGFKEQKKTPKVIIIEGIIGSGKTTLIHNLKAILEARGKTVTIAVEPVDKWVSSGLLGLFYSDKQRYAYTFQTAVFVDQSRVYNDAIKSNTDVILLERSLLSNTIFAENLHDNGDMNDLEFRLYQDWSSFWGETGIFPPNLFVYLNPIVEVAMERTRSRARRGEAGISEEYQRQIKEKHDAIFSKEVVVYGKKTVPVIELEDNVNLLPILNFIMN
jgi:deoxyadenosine/deoxycytidine kinase